MKKKYLYLASLVLLTGCFADDRNNYMVDDSFGVSAKSLVEEASVHTGTCSVGLSKNGKGQQEGTLDIILDPEALEKAVADYNTAHKTDYQNILGSLIDYSSLHFLFKSEEIVKELTLSWDPELVSSFMGEKENWVVPILIGSKDLTIGKGRELMLVHLTRCNLNVPQRLVPYSIGSKNVEAGKDGTQPILKETVTLDLNLTGSIKNMVMEFPVAIDNSLIEEYNATLEEDQQPFVAAPEGLITLLDEKVTLPEGSVGSTFRVQLDKSVLLNAEGKLEEFPSYVVPVRVKAEGLKARLSGKDFDLKGLSYNNMVTYFTVSYRPTVAGFVITREWGKYSTQGASWNAYFGGVANSDRNFTMDADYIYVPETSTEYAKIWKIKVSNPEDVSQVTPPANPTGYFKTTAARVIESGSTLNGGNPILVVSNMVMTEGGDFLKLYIYDKGTSKEPSEWAMKETNLGRRLGDIFTIHGSFANGGFLFKDWNQTYGNGTILVWRTAFDSVPNYDQTPRNPTWNTIKEEGGRAAFYPYPGQATPQEGIYTGTDSAYYVTEQGSNVYTWNASSFNATPAEGYYNGAADFNFFEFHGKRYIAYVKTVSSQDGRFYVLEGELTDSWKDMLGAKRKVIYQAAIQQDVAFADGEYHQELEVASPLASGNSGIGCAVSVGDNVVYMMAGKQNVGLSLFSMNYNEE